MLLSSDKDIFCFFCKLLGNKFEINFQLVKALKTTEVKSFSLRSFYKSSYFEIKNLADFLEMNLNYFLGTNKEAFKIASIRILSHDAFWKMFLKLP